MEKKENKGVTLIALVITIIVLLILAGVTIMTMTGENSILSNSILAKENTMKSEIINNAKEDILKKQKTKRKYELTEDELNNILNKYGRVEAGPTNIFDGKLITDEKYEIPIKDIYDYEKKIEDESIEPNLPERPDNSVEPNTPPIEENVTVSNTKSYVGCYADFEGGINGGADGIIDGIIFADLAVGGNGNWFNDNGNYTIPTVKNGLKEYFVRDNKVDSRWDNKPRKVIASKEGTIGKDRFYVMSLEDLDTSKYSWYKNARTELNDGNMHDFQTYTSVRFGDGKENTKKMIKKYNEQGYGINCNDDLWSFIQTKDLNNWYIPSRSEWAAFSNELNISNVEVNDEFYGKHKLKPYYWSSSQSGNYTAWTALFDTGYLGNDSVDKLNYIRLATNF